MATENVQVLDAPVPKQAGGGIRNKAQVQDWMVTMMAELLEIKPEDVDTRLSFDRYGLDSSAAIGMTDSLGAWVGCEFDPTLLYDYPTIEAVSQHLVETGKVKA